MRAAIVLAAGASRRFGRRDKLRAVLHKHALLEHAIARALDSGAMRVLVVASHSGRRGRITYIRAHDARTGLSASLAAGLAALRPIEREVLVFLADMPFACAPRMRLAAGLDAVRPFFRGVPGHPMLVRTKVAKVRLSKGDVGLAGALRSASVKGGTGNILDIDTPAALVRARRYGSHGSGPRFLTE